jgi:short-subunit dehydrogenase
MMTAVVTGAGRGLGREIAIRLAKRGLAVAVTDIDRDAAAATAADLGSHCWAIRQDVRDPESHRAIAAGAAERGPLKVWVNNAGVLRTDSAWGLDDELVKQHVDVNVLGVMWGSRAAVDVMAKTGGGHIINIASLSALCPTPGLAIYAATKHAVVGFSCSLQGDLDSAALPIKVSVICPDAIETAMVHNVVGNAHASLVFSNESLLEPGDVAAIAVDTLDNYRLLVALPRARATLAHLLRPFPELGLKLVRSFSQRGERNRRRRHNGAPNRPPT